MRSPEEVKQILVSQWLSKAQQDIAAARTLANAELPLLYPACFHAQQAAEKFLKAFLTHHQIEFTKTHNIGVLLDLASNADPELAARLAGASTLTPFGVELRYPGDAPEPNVGETREAVGLAERVRDEVLVRLG